MRCLYASFMWRAVWSHFGVLRALMPHEVTLVQRLSSSDKVSSELSALLRHLFLSHPTLAGVYYLANTLNLSASDNDLTIQNYNGELVLVRS